MKIVEQLKKCLDENNWNKTERDIFDGDVIGFTEMLIQFRKSHKLLPNQESDIARELLENAEREIANTMFESASNKDEAFIALNRARPWYLAARACKKFLEQ